MKASEQGTAMLQPAEDMFYLTAYFSEMDYETLIKYHHKPPDFTRYPTAMIRGYRTPSEPASSRGTRRILEQMSAYGDYPNSWPYCGA